MARRRPPTSPDNHAVAVVPVFTPDPHGAAMFSNLLNLNLGHLGQRVAMDTRGRAWHGWTQNPQGRMTGAANIGAGRPTVAPTTRLDQQSGAVAADSVQQVFASRMAERRFS